MRAVVTFGEIMLRLTPPGPQRFAQAPCFEITFGGAEANVAVTVARLGGAAEFVTRLPANEIAQRAIDELRGIGVGVDKIRRGGERIGIYFLETGASQRAGKVIYDRGQSAFAEAQPEDFNWEAIFRGAAWFHWSGITPALSSSTAAVTAEACAAARGLGLRVSFDLNFRAKLWTTERARAVLAPLMPYVDLCCIGSAEARQVFGIEGDADAEIAGGLMERFGCKMVAMPQRSTATASQTGWGATLFSGGNAFVSRRYDITIIDRVGAGDSFTGALIFSLQRGDDLQKAIDFAVAAGCLKHSIPGDYNLVSLAEVEALAQGGDGGRVQR